MLQCVAMCWGVLQCVAVCCSAVCCSELQCVAVCWGVLQCDTVCCIVFPDAFVVLHFHVQQIFKRQVCCSVLQCVAVCCSVLQCVAVCCSMLQCVVVCCVYTSGAGAALAPAYSPGTAFRDSFIDFSNEPEFCPWD